MTKTEFISDYHTHTTFSMDGQDSMWDMCVRAAKMGLSEIAFTEHVEWVDGWYGGHGFEVAAAYFEALSRCQLAFAPKGLQVLAGAEMGNVHQYPAQVQELLATHEFDVRIASLHWLHGYNIHSDKCFQGWSIEQTYLDYFSELGKMAQAAPVDFIAHFDRIFRAGDRLGSGFDILRLERAVRHAFEHVIDNGIGLEINTLYLSSSAAWRERLTTLLSWYVDMGGDRIFVNSDAHATGEIIQNRPIALEILKKLGVSQASKLITQVK